MLEHLLIVMGGILIGTASGVLPGIGTTIALIVATPVLLQLDIIQLFLFYMAILSTAQFTGTIPSVFLQVPGEANSLPTVVEGSKFRKRNLNSLAIGLCAVGSLFGSLVAVVITFFGLPYVIDFFTVFLKDSFKIVLYAVVLLASIFAFNNKRYILNFVLLSIGYFLSMIGPDLQGGTFRYTFGIEAMEEGIPFYPLILGLIVAPALFTSVHRDIRLSFIKEKLSSFTRVFFLFLRNIGASIRGAVIGFFAAMSPGFGTLLSTNLSYAVESKLNKNYPSKKLVAAETANNSGGFGMLLPLVLLGIPLTSSEFILFNYLIEAGWSPYQFENLEQNGLMLMQTLVPWFVFINFIALLIAWPLAKFIIVLMQKLKKVLNIFIALVCFTTCVYLGIDNYQLVFYITCLVVVSLIAIKFKEINLMPILFSFILGNELEFVISRYITLWTH